MELQNRSVGLGSLKSLLSGQLPRNVASSPKEGDGVVVLKAYGTANQINSINAEEISSLSEEVSVLQIFWNTG